MSRSGRLRQAIIVAWATVAALVVLLWALGGPSWVSSPASWGVIAFAALVLLVAEHARQRPRQLLLGLPTVVGGAAAVALGAWDYVPWATSPVLWLGVLSTLLTGAWLVRTHRARARDVIGAAVLGIAVFGLAIIAVYAVVVFVWMVWRPFG